MSKPSNLTATSEWAKHLRKEGKRQFHSTERLNSRADIRHQLDQLDDDEDYTPRSDPAVTRTTQKHTS